MINPIINSMPKRAAIGVLSIALLFGMIGPTAQAQVNSTASLQAQIAQLMQMVATLQAKLVEQNNIQLEGGFENKNFAEGATVKSVSNLRVRMSPTIDGEVVRIIPAGSVGIILTSQNSQFQNPTVANGYTWYRVRYENLGITGWSAANWLMKSQDLNNYGSSSDISLNVPLSVQKDQAVPIRINVRNDNWNPEYRYILHFGDGSSTIIPKIYATEASLNTAHVYATAGVYTVTVTYTDWGSADPNNDIYGIKAMKNVGHERNQVVKEKRVTVSADETTSYRIEIENPRNGNSFELGDRITVTWDQRNLSNEQGIITLEGGPNNVQRHIKQSIAIGDERATVVLPNNDRSIVPGEYELKLWVSYIKDGDPKGVNDSVKIVITGDPRDEESSASARALQAMIKELSDQIRAANADISDEDEIEEMPEDELQREISRLMGMIAAENGNSEFQYRTAPKKNNFACNRSQRQKYSEGSVACYGMWDYGNDFGNDKDMCGMYRDGQLGCKVKAPVCTSGEAKATKYYSNSQFKRMSGSIISGIARNLQSDVTTIKEGVAGLWEYSCVDNSSDQDVSTAPLSSMAIGFGVYEGSYPAGVRRSGGYRPQGGVEVYISAGSNSDGSLTLVLTSYEPVLWKITGPGRNQIGQVYASGYYKQEVTGLPGVAVTKTSHEEGDRDFYYSYENTGSNFEKLHSFVQSKFNTKFTQYYGRYSTAKFEVLGWKG